jgi:hypothetical protein
MAMWASDALWLKAKTFIDKANAVEHANPDFGLWSALALELLARAALTNIHQALNADPKDERNLFFALGIQVVEQPRSLPAHSVYPRLEKLGVAGFGKPQRDFCDYMGLLRNVELHTGELAFARVNANSWLPRFYSVCRLLCESMGKTLTEFLGDDVGGAAEGLVTAFATAQEKVVKDKVSQHRKGFEAKPPDERAKLSEEAEREARMLPLGRTSRLCPACGSTGILRGELIRELEPVYEEGELLVDQEYTATTFNCGACGLSLATIDEVGLAGVDVRFTERTATSLHERFQPEFGDDYENM